MKAKQLLVAIGVTLLTSAPVWAEQHGDNPQLLARLEQMHKDCEWKTRNLTGGAKGVQLLHHTKLGNVIEQIKNGQSVDPKEIDAVVKGHTS
jgi:hypothetical protein